MTKWRIHYEDSILEGYTEEDWKNAPETGVQVVVLLRNPIVEEGERRWIGVTDRVMWTGTDDYDPFGWGTKIGTLVSDEDYWRIWEEAKTWPK